MTPDGSQVKSAKKKFDSIILKQGTKEHIIALIIIVVVILRHVSRGRCKHFAFFLLWGNLHVAATGSQTPLPKSPLKDKAPGSANTHLSARWSKNLSLHVGIPQTRTLLKRVSLHLDPSKAHASTPAYSSLPVMGGAIFLITSLYGKLLAMAGLGEREKIKWCFTETELHWGSLACLCVTFNFCATQKTWVYKRV